MKQPRVYPPSMPPLNVHRPKGGRIFPNARPLDRLAALALAALTACAAPRATVVDGALLNEVRGFKVPLLRNGWNQFDMEGVEIAFRAEPGGQVAGVFVSCEGERMLPLKTLARRLFFGIAAKRIVSQEVGSLDGAEAIHTILEGRLTDQDVVVSSYVAKDAECVYDLVYAASPRAFDDRLPEFERFVKGWTFTRRGLAPEAGRSR
jgi:hypothetical protein